MEWVKFHSPKTRPYGRYADWRTKSVIIVHPNGYAYLGDEVSSIFPTGRFTPVLGNKPSGKWVGLRLAEEGDPTAYKVTGMDRKYGMGMITCATFLKESGLLSPHRINIWLVERAGDVAAIDVSKGTIASLLYQKRPSYK